MTTLNSQKILSQMSRCSGYTLYSLTQKKCALEKSLGRSLVVVTLSIFHDPAKKLRSLEQLHVLSLIPPPLFPTSLSPKFQNWHPQVISPSAPSQDSITAFPYCGNLLFPYVPVLLVQAVERVFGHHLNYVKTESVQQRQTPQAIFLFTFTMYVFKCKQALKG